MGVLAKKLTVMIRLVLICLLAGAAGSVLVLTGALDSVIGFVGITQATRPADSIPAAIPGNEEQIVMVYFGASNCTWCIRPRTHDLLRRAASSLRETAEENAIGFVAMGVALDRQAEAGLDHLLFLGIFDQVASGYGYANAGAIDMFQGVMPRISGTPTVAVVRRQLNAVGGFMDSRNARLVAFKVGVQQLGPWVDAGTPLRSVERASRGGVQHDARDSQAERRVVTGF